MCVCVAVASVMAYPCGYNCCVCGCCQVCCCTVLCGSLFCDGYSWPVLPVQYGGWFVSVYICVCVLAGHIDWDGILPNTARCEDFQHVYINTTCSVHTSVKPLNNVRRRRGSQSSLPAENHKSPCAISRAVCEVQDRSPAIYWTIANPSVHNLICVGSQQLRHS